MFIPQVTTINELRAWLSVIAPDVPITAGDLLYIMAVYKSDCLRERYTQDDWIQALVKGIPPVTLRDLQDALNSPDKEQVCNAYSSLQIQVIAAGYVNNRIVAKQCVKLRDEFSWD